MKLYFVRHGETNSNLQKSVVSFSDELTENGRKQAQQIAGRIYAFPIDVIITSPHRRAKETAEIISKKINKKIIDTVLLGERKWPSQFEGKLLIDPDVEKYFTISKEKNNSDPTWHYSDEENFQDVKKRAEDFIEYISTMTDSNILAVSHEYFIKLILASMMHGDQLSYDMFRSFFKFTNLSNVSLTLCEKEQSSWKLITINDQQHLG